MELCSKMDWERTVPQEHGVRVLSVGAWNAALFWLADLWTDGISAHEYATFLVRFFFSWLICTNCVGRYSNRFQSFIALALSKQKLIHGKPIQAYGDNTAWTIWILEIGRLLDCKFIESNCLVA